MSDPGPRRGPAVAIALLSAGFLISTTIAVVEFAQLSAANDRVDELEAELASQGGGDGGGFLDELEELFEDLAGEAGGGPAGLGGGLDLFSCLLPDQIGAQTTSTTGTLDQQVDAIADQVERIRGLAFTGDVDPEFLSPQETAARVQQLFLEEYTPQLADREQRILTALGAIRPGTDLREVRSEALGGQVAGFYEPETGELVVRQAGESISSADRVTLAHELDHALTDQTLGIPLPDDPTTGREDADLAAVALVEGDATLTMQRFAATLPFDEQFGLVDPEQVAEAEAGLAAMPDYLQRELLFPYQDGLTFMCAVYGDGGWEAVNRAYDDPPATSAQILFPQRYAEGEGPADSRAPGTLGKTWTLASTQQLGAANLMWLFMAPGGDPGRALDDPRGRAAGWAGGELQLWTREQDTAVGIAFAEEPGARDLCGSIIEWYGKSFADDRETTGVSGGAPSLIADGPRQDALVSCESDEVRVGIGPDLATARALAR